MKIAPLSSAFLLSALLLCAPAAAQVTLGEATLPEAGDRFASAVDTAYADANGNVGRSGADQTWVFGDIDADGTACTTFRAADQGAAGGEFPDADLVLTTATDCDDTDAPEFYLRREGDGLDILGVGAGADAGLPVLRLDPTAPYQRAPFAFGDEASVTTTQVFGFPGAILADLVDDPDLLAALALVDSLRITLDLEASVVADGYGRAGESADALTEVLRVRRTTDASQLVEVRVPFLGFIDIGSLPNVDSSLLPSLVQSVVNYEWWSPDAAEPLYRVNVDSAGAILSAERSTTVVNVTEVASAGDAVGVRLQGGRLVLTRSGATDEALAVRVYDAAGATLASVTMAPGQAAARVGAEGWPAGLYVTEVRGARGRVEAHRVVVW